jgi:hypothetical protein
MVSNFAESLSICCFKAKKRFSLAVDMLSISLIKSVTYFPAFPVPAIFAFGPVEFVPAEMSSALAKFISLPQCCCLLVCSLASSGFGAGG